MTDFLFANLTGGLLARKGEARPAAGMVVRSSILCSAPTLSIAPGRTTRQIGFSESYTVTLRPKTTRTPAKAQ